VVLPRDVHKSNVIQLFRNVLEYFNVSSRAAAVVEQSYAPDSSGKGAYFCEESWQRACVKAKHK
jgi:hypothetical protein